MKKGGVQTTQTAPLQSFLHDRGKLPQHSRPHFPHPGVVLFQLFAFLRVHAEGMSMDGYLIEIVGTPSLQGNQLPDRGKVNVEDIAIQGHLSHIGSDVGNTGFGDAFLYLFQLVGCYHHMKVLIPLAAGSHRSSRSRLRLWWGGSFTLSNSFFSGHFGRGEGDRLFKIPSSILSFCFKESSVVCR